MTQRNVIRNPAREQITAAIKAALDAFPNRSELARRIGVSRKQTYEWESGNNTPSLETLAALAEATGTQIVLAFGPEPETDEEAAPDIPERLDRMENRIVSEVRAKLWKRWKTRGGIHNGSRIPGPAGDRRPAVA